MADPMETFIAMNASIHGLKNRGTLLGRLHNFLGIYDERYARYYDEGNDSSEAASGSEDDTGISDHEGWGIPMAEIEQATDLGEYLLALRRTFTHSVGGSVHTAPDERLALIIGGRALALCEGRLLSAADVLPHCTPAAFGDLRARATVLDETVRRASECRAPAFELVQVAAPGSGSGRGAHAAPALLEDIAEAVTSSLLPRGFSLRPHKLNVYGPSGHFQPHVDTPTDPRMVGSLVIALPSPFIGGELIVAEDAGGRAAGEGVSGAAASESAGSAGSTSKSSVAIEGSVYDWGGICQPGVLP